MKRFYALPLLFSLVLLWGFPAHTQVIKNSTAAEIYRDAEAALLEGKVEQALKLFERSLKVQPGLSAARRGMGLCYGLLRDYPSAIEQYEAVLASDSLYSRALYYQLGEAHYKAGHHKKALAYFQRYEQLQKVELDTFSMNTERELQDEQRYLAKLESNIRACEVTLDSIKFINITQVANLGNAVNSKDDDYFPYISNGQRQLFYTRKTANGDEDLFESRLEKDKWSKGAPVKAINTDKDEGMCTLVRDGRRLYFTACGREGGLGICDIWEALVSAEGEIDQATPLKGFANSDRWESQASISCDGSTLYFASEREGGLGKSDLYYSKRQADGSWSTPVNLGPRINTDDYEEAPFITNDGGTLYFSSYGHPGMGDQDIFMSWLDEKGEWSQPINLGPPVNTAFRELGLFLSADGSTGYFASERPGGFGKLDIYQFQLDEELYSQPMTFVEGLVVDSALDMAAPATVNFADRPPITTGPDGRFFLCIPAGHTLDISVDKKYFHPYQNRFLIPEWDNKQFYTIEILLKSVFEFPEPQSPQPIDTANVAPSRKKVFREFHHTVFFGFDKKEMDIEEMEKLGQFLQLLKDKNIQSLEIAGFADEIGADKHNMELSLDRAKEAALFITRNGLGIDNIIMEAKGELINDKPKEENRKVEIRVVTVE
ncbi:MAG: PD40 domain-containing protein [Lewinellaceae bacterium]|nr:PD40 domain-containing protein [Lewinellaceae bacterium]